MLKVVCEILPLRDEVVAGAAFLDTNHPGWVNKVDPNIVDVTNAQLCILGQLYGSSEAGCKALGVSNTRDFLARYGFEASSIGYEKNVSELNSDWVELIETRLGMREFPVPCLA